jgi:hypothetical protein
MRWSTGNLGPRSSGSLEVSDRIGAIGNNWAKNKKLSAARVSIGAVVLRFTGDWACPAFREGWNGESGALACYGAEGVRRT